MFYRSQASNEPVREWLKSLDRRGKKIIGEDIKTVQFGWPLGMPLVRKIETELWEVRSDISFGIARVIFTIQEDLMVLLHSFVKKTQKIPKKEMEVSRRRLKQIKEET